MLPSVCISTGLPPTGRNCLGRSLPIRKPFPPATIITDCFIDSLAFYAHRFYQFVYFIFADQQIYNGQSKFHSSARSHTCDDISVPNYGFTDTFRTFPGIVRSWGSKLLSGLSANLICPIPSEPRRSLRSVFLWQQSQEAVFAALHVCRA